MQRGDQVVFRDGAFFKILFHQLVFAFGDEQLKRLSLTAPLIKAKFDPGEARIPAGRPAAGSGRWAAVGRPRPANTMEIDADRINIASQDYEAVATDWQPWSGAPPNENDGLRAAACNKPFTMQSKTIW